MVIILCLLCGISDEPLKYTRTGLHPSTRTNHASSPSRNLGSTYTPTRPAPSARRPVSAAGVGGLGGSLGPSTGGLAGLGSTLGNAQAIHLTSSPRIG